MKEKVRNSLLCLIDLIESDKCYISAFHMARVCVQKSNNQCDVAAYWFKPEYAPRNHEERELMFYLFIKLARYYVLGRL